MGRVSHGNKSVQSLVTIRSNLVVRRIVASQRGYADWLPYDLTRKRAKAFLSTGVPFTTLPDSERKKIDGLATIRNALAHESAAAMARFQLEFVASKGLPVDQMNPAGYLRGQHRTGQTRFDYLLADAIAAFRSLC
jgi:hypothetical protein